MLYTGDEADLQEVFAVVFDEFHYMNDPDRGVCLACFACLLVTGVRGGSPNLSTSSHDRWRHRRDCHATHSPSPIPSHVELHPTQARCGRSR